MRVRKDVVTAVFSAALLAGTVAFAPASSAASYPNKNSSRTPGNSSGVVFHPYGDRFEIWDNVNDSYAAFVYYNYKGVDDKWKEAGLVKNGYTEVSHNVAESINGKHAYIYFQVCDGVEGCSKPSWYRTWGS